MTYIAGLCCGIALLLLSGCSGYAKFIDALNTRGLNSCVEGTVTVGSALTGSSGTLHVYSGTGGQDVSECIKHFKGVPIINVHVNKEVL